MDFEWNNMGRGGVHRDIGIQSRSLVASVSVKSRQSLGEKPTGRVASTFCNR